MKKFFWNMKVLALRLLHWRRVVRTVSRRMLEYDVFFEIQRIRHPKKIISIGVAPYTAHYPLLFPRAIITTIDNDPTVAQWGSSGRHKIMDAAFLGEIFEPNLYDIAFFNGVYGWGTNTEQHLKNSLSALHKVLKPDGLLLFGWNNTKTLDPIDIEANLTQFFRGFSPCKFLGRDYIQLNEGNRHCFRFFRCMKNNF